MKWFRIREDVRIHEIPLIGKNWNVGIFLNKPAAKFSDKNDKIVNLVFILLYQTWHIKNFPSVFQYTISDAHYM